MRGTRNLQLNIKNGQVAPYGMRFVYFTAGAVLGSQAFVDRFFERQREFFGTRRQSGGDE